MRSGASDCIRNASSKDWDDALHLAVGSNLLQVRPVHLLNEIHLIALQRDGQARILDIAEYGFLGAGGPVSQRRSLVDGGEERIPEKLDVPGVADQERGRW